MWYNYLVSYLNDPNEEHEVGITNAQENNPDPAIAELTKRMNAAFDAGRYAEAAAIAVSVTQRSVQELLETFLRHKVTVLRLDHEAFGIYAGQIEPTYDLQVDGALSEVVAAATEFGNRHAQQMILIARRLKPGETDPTSRLGLTIALGEPTNAGEAVQIAEIARACGFLGATFAPNRNGSIVVYHTESLEMTEEEFENAAIFLLDAMAQGYPHLQFQVEKFIIHMPRI